MTQTAHAGGRLAAMLGRMDDESRLENVIRFELPSIEHVTRLQWQLARIQNRLVGEIRRCLVRPDRVPPARGPGSDSCATWRPGSLHVGSVRSATTSTVGPTSSRQARSHGPNGLRWNRARRRSWATDSTSRASSRKVESAVAACGRRPAGAPPAGRRGAGSSREEAHALAATARAHRAHERPAPA